MHRLTEAMRILKKMHKKTLAARAEDKTICKQGFCLAVPVSRYQEFQEAMHEFNARSRKTGFRQVRMTEKAASLHVVELYLIIADRSLVLWQELTELTHAFGTQDP